MAAGAEVEVKFLLAERDLVKIKMLISTVSAARPPLRQRLRAIYFDTPNRDLWKHGFVLRIRASGKSYTQTVKRESVSGIARGEWEAETGGFDLDFDHIEETPLARLAAKSSVRGALRPAFEVKVERISHWLENGGGVIEASIDQGAIHANGSELGLCELELELKSGPRPALFSLARAFVAQAPLTPSLISKAERGHLLAEGVFDEGVKGSRPRLTGDMTCGQSFQEICRTCLHDFDLNRPGLEKLDNVEAVHQARVAIRRLRAAMALFRPVVLDISYRKLSSELQWLGRLLGAARDLDVLQAHLEQRNESELADPRPKDFLDSCKSERLRARQDALEALMSERGRSLLLDLTVWLDNGRWLTQPASLAEEPTQSFAGPRLKKRHKKLVKQGAGLAKLTPGLRHRIRIKAKELRYMAEFFVDVPGIAQDRKHLKKLINFCEKLQTTLGAIRDAEAMAEFMERDNLEDAATAQDVLAPGPSSRGKNGTEKELKKAVRAYLQLAALEAF